MTKPYSIKIFLPGGDPDGVRTIEKSNWSGAGIVIPRSLMGAAKTRRELLRTGVYLLVGPPEESGLPRVYVGEGDPIKPRLEQHATKKDFWTNCIAFTSKDENLNKAHVQYIESRLVALAAVAKRCVLDNGNVPTMPSGSVPGLVEIRVVPPYCSVDPGKDSRSTREDTTHANSTNEDRDAPASAAA